MKELRDIYRSPNFKSGAYQVGPIPVARVSKVWGVEETKFDKLTFPLFITVATDMGRPSNIFFVYRDPGIGNQNSRSS